MLTDIYYIYNVLHTRLHKNVENLNIS